MASDSESAPDSVAAERADYDMASMPLRDLHRVWEYLLDVGRALVIVGRDYPNQQDNVIAGLSESANADDGEGVTAILPVYSPGIFTRYGVDSEPARTALDNINRFVEIHGKTGLIAVHRGDMSYRDPAPRPKVVRRLVEIMEKGESGVLVTASDLYDRKDPTVAPNDPDAAKFYRLLSEHSFAHDFFEQRVKFLSARDSSDGNADPYEEAELTRYPYDEQGTSRMPYRLP